LARNSAAAESEGGQKGRGLGGSLPAGRQGIFARLLCRAKRGRERKHWPAARGAARQAQVRNPLRF